MSNHMHPDFSETRETSEIYMYTQYTQVYSEFETNSGLWYIFYGK